MVDLKGKTIRNEVTKEKEVFWTNRRKEKNVKVGKKGKKRGEGGEGGLGC